MREEGRDDGGNCNRDIGMMEGSRGEYKKQWQVKRPSWPKLKRRKSWKAQDEIEEAGRGKGGRLRSSR